LFRDGGEDKRNLQGKSLTGEACCAIQGGD
jgi:hypothetical protein